MGHEINSGDDDGNSTQVDVSWGWSRKSREVMKVCYSPTVTRMLILSIYYYVIRQPSGMNDDDSILLPVYSPTYPPENTSVTTSMPPNKPQKPSEAQGAKGIARLTVHISSTFRQNMPYKVGAPSRWSTAEFKFYYVVALFVIPVMIWIPMSLSLRKISFLY